MSFKAPDMLSQFNFEYNEVDEMEKFIRSILNKITAETKDELTKEFLNLHVTEELPQFNAPDPKLAQVIDIAFEKAINEPQYCPLLLKLCEPVAKLKLPKESAFREALRDKCLAMRDKKTTNKTAIDNETNEEIKNNMLKYKEALYKLRRKLGNITVIGQLYCWSLISSRTVGWWFYDLLMHTVDDQGNLPEPPYDEDSIFCMVKLAETVGKKIKMCEDYEGARRYLAQIMHQLLRLAPKCSYEISFLISGLKVHYDKNWEREQFLIDIPYTVTEIHNDTQAKALDIVIPRYFEGLQSRLIPPYSTVIRNPPGSERKYDVLETIERLCEHVYHKNSCGKYCTGDCPRIDSFMELITRAPEFWAEVEEFYPSVADQIKEDIENLQSEYEPFVENYITFIPVDYES